MTPGIFHVPSSECFRLSPAAKAEKRRKEKERELVTPHYICTSWVLISILSILVYVPQSAVMPVTFCRVSEKFTLTGDLAQNHISGFKTLFQHYGLF